MSVQVPWRTLRPNPRTQREEAAAATQEQRPDEGLSLASLTSEGFSANEALRRMAFGGICGGFTGVAFGAMDGQRSITHDKANKFPTTALKTKEVFRLTAMSGSLFGGFFAAYQLAKYGARIYRGEDDFFNVCIATAACVPAMVPFPAARQRLPYAALLVAMDTINNHVL
ncbi:unnamed protein product [Chrysoparadoxa australica]